jgi:hypothetical protein
MSLLTFVVPWVLLSLIATPFIGAIIARSLGAEDELDSGNSLDEEISVGEETVDSSASPVTLPVSQYRGPRDDGAEIA